MNLQLCNLALIQSLIDALHKKGVLSGNECHDVYVDAMDTLRQRAGEELSEEIEFLAHLVSQGDSK